MRTFVGFTVALVLLVGCAAPSGDTGVELAGDSGPASDGGAVAVDAGGDALALVDAGVDGAVDAGGDAAVVCTTTGSCRSDGICQEYEHTGAMLDSARSGCPSAATWSDGACDRTGAVRGCQYTLAGTECPLYRQFLYPPSTASACTSNSTPVPL